MALARPHHLGAIRIYYHRLCVVVAGGQKRGRILFIGYHPRNIPERI